MTSPRRRLRWLVPLLSSISATAAGAQTTGTTRPWFSSDDWKWLGGFAVAAAAVTPFDVHLAHEFQRPSVHRSATLSRTAAAVRAAGDPGALLSSIGLYAAGRVAGHSALADAGLHTTEAVLVSGFTTGVIKGIVGRARPYTVRDTSASILKPFHRAAGYTSFPSGHTTVAFASASALSREISQTDFALRHRTTARLASPLLFGAATAVGLSRMYHDAHWASDVIAAAGIGTVTGRIMVRAQHRQTPDRVDRWLLPATIAPSPHGLALVWQHQF